MRGVAVLGSTGSIGESALAVLGRHPDSFRLEALSAGDLAAWTLNGYPGAVNIPSTLPADPGLSNSSALRDALASSMQRW